MWSGTAIEKQKIAALLTLKVKSSTRSVEPTLVQLARSYNLQSALNYGIYSYIFHLRTL